MASMLAMLRDLAERLYRESHWPVTGTATAGTTTTLVDTVGLIYSSGDANQFDRKYAYIEFSTGESSRVTEGGYAGGTGTLTLSPAVTGIGTEKYIITDQHIDVLKNAINRVQANIFPPTFFPLSIDIVTGDDNDMENDPASNYTAGTDATPIQTLAGAFHGAWGMTVVGGSGTDDYVTPGTIFVTGGKQYRSALSGKLAAGALGSLTLQMYDVTNSAEIDSAATSIEDWTDLTFDWTAPSSCKQVQARFVVSSSLAITYCDDYQIWVPGRHIYPLPSWITRPEQLLDVRSFAQGTGGPGDNDYRANETRSRPLSYGFESVDRRGNLPLHIWVDAGSARPFIYALRPLDELSADTSNSVAEQDFVVRFAEKLVREPDKASETMALLRAIHFQRVTTELPNRIGVSM